MGKSIRDPIHGFIDVDDDALKVISSPFFQRLRHIHQTGFAYLVYPGMHHTRIRAQSRRHGIDEGFLPVDKE